MYNVKNSSNQIKLGAIISYLNIIFNIISGLLYTPWMIKQIGQSNYGLYTLSISLISMLTVDFGIGASISRFISKYRAEQDEESISNFLGLVYKIYLIISIIIFIILTIVFLNVDKFYMNLTVSEIQKLKVIYCISGLFTVISFPFMPLNGIIISYESFIFQKSLDLANRILNILLMFIMLSKGLGLYALVLINTGLGILSIIAKLIYINRNISIKPNIKYTDKNMIKEISSFSIWTSINGIAQRFVINISPSILAAFANSNQITIFSIAMTIEGYVYMLSTSVSGMFLARVSKIIYGKQTNSIIEVENLMIKVGRIQLLIIGLIVSIFASIGNEFITLWMGDNFKTAYIVALFLIVNSIIVLTQEIANTMIVATNKIRYETISVVTVAIISFLLSSITSKYYGAIGTGLSICIGTFIGRVIIRNIIYRKVLGLDIKRFFRECHLSMCVPIVLTFILGCITLDILPGLTLYIFIMKVLILSIFYFIFMWLLSLNEYEKDIFLNILNKIKNIKNINKRSNNYV